MYGKIVLLGLTLVVYYISLNKKMFLWFNFWNILNIFISDTNTWIAIIKFWGHHASQFCIMYRHIWFDYTHTSLIVFLLFLFFNSVWIYCYWKTKKKGNQIKIISICIVVSWQSTSSAVSVWWARDAARTRVICSTLPIRWPPGITTSVMCASGLSIMVCISGCVGCQGIRSTECNW